ncbi:MAG: DUF4142 domain-containing protein [Steroidobacteraceae bacterium]
MNIAATCGLILAAVTTTAFAAEPIGAGSNASTQIGISSESFVQNATQDGIYEVEAGKLASTQATQSEIKAFAQLMVTDHGKANATLGRIAEDKKIAAPKQLDAKHKEMFDALKAKSGTAFDTAYVNEMTEGHKKAISLFTAASSSTAIDPALKAFAKETLPTLQMHNSKVLQLHTR